MKKDAYLGRILAAKVYDVAVESPLDPLPSISRRTANHVLLKREDKQAVFSFKLRGAYNKMANLSPARLARAHLAAGHIPDARAAITRALGLAYGPRRKRLEALKKEGKKSTLLLVTRADEQRFVPVTIP